MDAFPTGTTLRPDPGRGGRGDGPAFSHEAFFYAGQEEFLSGASAFVAEGLESDEAVMVALPVERLELLRSALGPSPGPVVFADMHDIGRNPGRIIPAWRRFVMDNLAAGRPFRGIGEPIWHGRGAAELTECQLHEFLLNLAFAGGPAWRLLCPYDTTALGAGVLEEARRSHPFVLEPGGLRPSGAFEARSGPQLLHGSLPEPPAGAEGLDFDGQSLVRVRSLLSGWAAGALPAHRAADLVLAAHEVAANSVRHGGGSGRLRYWRAGDVLVCEVSDFGRVHQALVGRELVAVDEEMGRGLWLAHQLCDLVQLRSSDEGTVVRLWVSPH